MILSVGQMAKRWLILFICSSGCPSKTPMFHFHTSTRDNECFDYHRFARHCISWLKERLVPTVAACSSLIRMLHQISTEIQMFNESSSTWR